MSSTSWRFSCALTFLLSGFCAHAYTKLSDQTIKSLPRPGDDFDINKGSVLSPILRTRVPGSEGSAAVQNHFTDFFRTKLPDWNLEFQNSTSTTPLSKGAELPFVNIIASRDPPWAEPGDTGRLTLVAHYDSKVSPEGFIGAIDSAAPCAMIMHAVRSIDGALTKKWERMKTEGVDSFGGVEEHKGIQVIFLDGEEAFLSWTATDSLYGARSLAEQWDSEYHAAKSTYKTKLNSISLFVLLDLLGSSEYTPVPSWFKTTHWAYKNMAAVEKRLRKLGQLKGPNKKPWLNEAGKSDDGQFNSRWMQDDHIPFIDRGVEVLHLIPAPFPHVWHKIEDDGEHLDIPTVEDWAMITTAFTAEWMDLEGFFDSAPMPAADRQEKRDKNPKENVTSKTEL
ncbi:MAG: hypothetical protein Q9227_004932 [Pyrenula ochraceoflavens]